MRLGPTCLRAALAFLVLTVPAAAIPPPPLVTNGDFETPVVAGPPEVTTPTGWSTGTAGAKLVGPQSWAAASGVQSVELSSSTTNPSGISQPIAAVNGQRYDLSFSYAGNPIRDASTPLCDSAHAVKTLDLRWGGWLLGQFKADTAGRTTADLGWKTAHVLVDGGPSSVDLGFWANDGACGPVVDNVALGVPGAAQTSVRLYQSSSTFTGQATTLSASVIGSSAALTPTGTVQFKLDGQPVGGPVALVGGNAQSSALTSFQAGAHTMAATYAPDSAAFDASETTGPFSVGRAYTAATFLTAPSPPVAGEPFDLSATVAAVPPGTGLPTGTLDLAALGDWVGQSLPLDQNGTTTGVSMVAPAGPLDVAGIYSGDANYQESSSYASLSIVRALVAVVLTPSKSPVGFGERYTVDAVVRPTNTNVLTPTGTVQFAVDGVKTGAPTAIGADGRASTSVTAPATATAQTVAATFGGDANFTGSAGRLLVPIRSPVAANVVSPPPATKTPSPLTPTLGPVFTFEVARSKLVKSLALGQGVSIRCNWNCSARVLLRLSAKQARALGISARRPLAVGSGVRMTLDKRRYVVKAAFVPKYRARLAKAPRLVLEVIVTVSDATGRHTAASKAVTLNR